MMTVLERIEKLYSIANIDTADPLNMAEIYAVSDEINRLADYLQGIRGATAVNVFTFPNKASIDAALQSTEYRIDGRKIYISKYDIETVGKIFNAWFGIVFDIYFDGNGKNWEFIDNEAAAWDDVARRELRWTMTESR